MGAGQLEVGEEDVGHRGVVVLARVRDGRIDARGGERRDERADLDEVGSCSDDDDDAHRLERSQRCRGRVHEGLDLLVGMRERDERRLELAWRDREARGQHALEVACVAAGVAR